MHQASDFIKVGISCTSNLHTIWLVWLWCSLTTRIIYFKQDAQHNHCSRSTWFESILQGTISVAIEVDQMKLKKYNVSENDKVMRVLLPPSSKPSRSHCAPNRGLFRDPSESEIEPTSGFHDWVHCPRSLVPTAHRQHRWIALQGENEFVVTIVCEERINTANSDTTYQCDHCWPHWSRRSNCGSHEIRGACLNWSTYAACQCWSAIVRFPNIGGGCEANFPDLNSTIHALQQ